MLDAGEKERSDAKDDLTNALSSFKYAIESSFNLDPGTLLNCLSQMSFAGGSFAGSSALIGSQILLALKDADENIRDDAGQKVNTSYLVKQLTSFIGHDWENSVKESRDGFIDDSSSYKFLDEASRIADLIDSFAQHPDLAKDVNQTAHALAKYVDMIDRRNSLVDQYNDSVRRLMFLNAQSDRLSVYADDIAANTTAGTNDADAGVGGLLQRAHFRRARDLPGEPGACVSRRRLLVLERHRFIPGLGTREPRRGHRYGARSRVQRTADCPRRRDRRVPPDTWCFSGETNR